MKASGMHRYSRFVSWEAVQYLRAHPPRKQILKTGKLDWKQVENNGTQLEQILYLVRTIRNNLFHGGKFPCGPVEDAGRDTKLLESCIIILRKCLSLDKDVYTCFREKN